MKWLSASTHRQGTSIQRMELGKVALLQKYVGYGFLACMHILLFQKCGCSCDYCCWCFAKMLLLLLLLSLSLFSLNLIHHRESNISSVFYFYFLELRMGQDGPSYRIFVTLHAFVHGIQGHVVSM